MPDSTKKIILYLLIIISISLGFVIFKKTHVGKSVSLDSKATSSSDIEKLFNPPGPNATKDEIIEHSKLAAKLAILGNTVEFKDCKATPIVLQIKYGLPVTFKNSSDYDITLFFDMKNSLNVSSLKSVSNSKVFIHGPGVYGYACGAGNSKALAGFIYLTQ